MYKGNRQEKPSSVSVTTAQQQAMGSKAVVDALPPPILALFQPGPPIIYMKNPPERKCRPLDGMAQYASLFEDVTPPKPPPVTASRRRPSFGSPSCKSSPPVPSELNRRRPRRKGRYGRKRRQASATKRSSTRRRRDVSRSLLRSSARSRTRPSPSALFRLQGTPKRNTRMATPTKHSSSAVWCAPEPCPVFDIPFYSRRRVG